MGLGRSFFFGVVAIVTTYLVSRWRTPTFPETLLKEYDYIIVGAGSAGCVLAARLSEDSNVSVLLLEAGGEETANQLVSVPIAWMQLQGSNVDWGYKTTPQKNSARGYKNNELLTPRGKVLGGSSSVNGFMYVRGHPTDYNDWAENGCEGWSYKDVLPYFLKSEDVRIDRLKSSKYHAQGGLLAVSDTTASVLTDVLVKAGRHLGIPEVDCNARDTLGISRMQATVDRGARGHTARMFLRPSMGRANLHVSINSHVHKVTIKDSRAVGVEFLKDGRKMNVSVRKEVILSAGSFATPQILMLSGVGPKEHLQEHKIPVKADLPVGKNLQDHFLVGITSRINVSYSINKNDAESFTSLLKYMLFGTGPLASPTLEAVGFFQLDEEMKKVKKGLPDMQIHLQPITMDNVDLDFLHKINMKTEVIDYFNKTNIPGMNGFAFWVVLLHPKSRGSVRLKSTNPLEHPLIDPNYFSHPDDIVQMIRGLRQTQKLIKTPPFQEIGATPDDRLFKPCVDKHGHDTDEYWECHTKTLGTTTYHPTTTCKMGAVDDPTSVVDNKLRVKGISGLRVADASVMPNVPSGNTNAPVIMIAEKLADMLRGIDSVAALRDQIKDI